MAADPDDPSLVEALAAARDDEEPPPGMLLAQAKIAGNLFGTEAAGLGRFRVLARLGGGGMGVVYSAYDPQLDRGVALKTVHVPTTSALTALGEAKALAKLSHPNVVPVFDVGIESGHVYIVMELVRGATLRDWVVGKELRDILEVYRQAALALAAAHDAGLVHRDFKPENALVGLDGRVRVVDFGLACEATAGSGKRAGTPRYMPPESEVTPAGDQYSFGLALGEAVPEPRPRWVQDVVERATAQAPADRFTSMHEVLRALGRDPARIRLRRAIAAGVAVAIAAVGTGAFVVGRQASDAPFTEPCNGAERELDTAWSPAGQGAQLARISALSAYGKELAPELAKQLVDYRARWVANHRAACFAHHRGEQSDALLDRRMACLDRSRAGLATVSELTSAANGDALPGLPRAVRAIPDPSACADVSALLADVDRPAAMIASSVAEVRQSVARARVTNAAGLDGRAVSIAEAAVAKARMLGYPPLLAEALLVEGHARMTERDRAAAVARLSEAQTVGLSAGLLAIGVEAWARRAWLQGVYGKPTDGTEVIEALAARTGPFARALLANNLGSVALAHDDRVTARAKFELALAAAVGVSGPDAVELAWIRFNMSLVVDDPAVRDELLRAAEADFIRLLGRDHPDTLNIAFARATSVAAPLPALAATLTDVCNREELHPAFARRIADCWVELASVRDVLGERPGALIAVDRALAMGADFQIDAAEAAGYARLWRDDNVGARTAFEGGLRALPSIPNESWFRQYARAKLQIGLGRTHAAAGRRSAARAILEMAVATLAVTSRDHPAATVQRRLEQARAELAKITAIR